MLCRRIVKNSDSVLFEISLVTALGVKCTKIRKFRTTVQQAMALCSALGAVYGLDGLPQTAAPAIDWGDGVLYDRARIWAEQRELVDAGLLRPELALAWYFDLPHETEAELAEIRRRFMGDAGRAQ